MLQIEKRHPQTFDTILFIFIFAYCILFHVLPRLFLVVLSLATIYFKIFIKKKAVGLERGPLSLVSTTEELLDRKVAAPV
jgi:hypothetical protein